MPGDAFYHTPEWRELRRRALKRDHYRCVLCGASLRKIGSSRVDHIAPRRARPDLALVLANLRSLCAPCDNRQSVEKLERPNGPRRERVDADGLTTAWRDDLARRPQDEPTQADRGADRHAEARGDGRPPRAEHEPQEGARERADEPAAGDAAGQDHKVAHEAQHLRQDTDGFVHGRVIGSSIPRLKR